VSYSRVLIFDDAAKVLHNIDGPKWLISEGIASRFHSAHDVIQNADLQPDQRSLDRRLSDQGLHSQRFPAEVFQHIGVETRLNEALANLGVFPGHRPQHL